ncbi:MAG: Fe-S cluster assembly protein SufE [Pelagibacteraceae bacterium]|nr:Fe-S cluster assembly protein SufE [Pelagibacteraceae bacterium]
MSIQEKINELVENFSYFDNWEDKYEYIIDLGKKIPKLDEKYKKNEFKIQGCTSNLWLVPIIDGKKIFFNGGSDSVIIQGLFAIIAKIYSGEQAKDILDNKPDFLTTINLKEHLGPSRSNGLNSLIKKIQSTANSVISS